jgi:hypothetical protein
MWSNTLNMYLWPFPIPLTQRQIAERAGEKRDSVRQLLGLRSAHRNHPISLPSFMRLVKNTESPETWERMQTTAMVRFGKVIAELRPIDFETIVEQDEAVRARMAAVLARPLMGPRELMELTSTG